MSKKKKVEPMSDLMWDEKQKEIKLDFKSFYPEMVRVQTAKAFRTGYIVRAEVLQPKQYGSVEMVKQIAYNWNGVRIGQPDMAVMLCDGKGIFPEPIDKKKGLCQIGFSELDQKWYGWSTRAVAGFGVGSQITMDDYGFRAANEKDFVADLHKYYRGLDVQIATQPEKDGVKVYYDLSIQPHERDMIPPDRFHPFPEEWGKGKWKAKTLDDAKEMAIEFAKDVATDGI